MKKLFSMLIAVLLVSLASAADIAYIVKDNPQPTVLDAIDDLALTYNIIDDSDIPSTDFSEYEMILVWDDAIMNYDKLPVTEKNSLIANTYYLKEWKIAEYKNIYSPSGIAKAKVYEDNWLTETMLDIFAVYDKKEIEIYYLPKGYKRAPGLKRDIVTYSYEEGPVVGTIKPGGALYGGGFSKERIAFFGITYPEHWTEDSRILFKKLVEWTMHGGDNDYDGFFYDEDCNDYNEDINPDSEEVPYNGLDDDCYGGDLVDVDGDGYDSWEVGGKDCDDSDAEINPDAEIIMGDGIDQNCKENYPEILTIPGLILEEDFGTYTLDLSEFKNDDEDYGEYLKWSVESEGIYSEINGDTLNLQSVTDSFCLEGCGFTLTLNDSDGMNDTLFVEVVIRPVNDAPICQNISTVEWEEEGEAELNLKDYCSDPEGDSLDYEIYDTSPSDDIYMKSFEAGKAVFSSVKNWNGNDWIIFEVSDGTNSIITNNITLNVLPVNDAPICSIPDIEWEEDFTYDLELSDYCSDVDEDSLEYGIEGNENITIIINNSLAYLIPYKDWYGTEKVVFSASDGEFSALSAVNLTVLEMNEPPEFLSFNCTANITEDIEENCKINAEDFENDSYEFSVSGENNLDCEFDGDILTYKSYQDYEGEASCTLRVSDESGYTNKEFIVNIEGVNDAPIMTYRPDTDKVMIITGDIKLFEAEIWDVEEDSIEKMWFLDEEKVSEASSYLFNQAVGDYKLKIIASDGKEETSHKWDVRVGEINEFTCKEVGGFVCEENELCYGEDRLNVKGESVCCEVACQPRFGDVERCEDVEDGIKIKIKDPKEGEEFQIGEIIEVDFNVRNNLDKDIDVDIDAYLYNLEEDEVIEEENDGIDIREGESEDFSFEFKAEEDLNVEHEYGIFVKVNGEYCQEKFLKVKFEREEEVVIKDINIAGDLECGGYLDLDVKVRNIGEEEQEIRIKVENQELGIYEETDLFELDEYGKRNDERKENFYIKLPKDAGGDYSFLIKVLFNGEERRDKQEVSVKCKEQTSQKIEPIFLDSREESFVEEDEENNNKRVLFAITMVTTIFVLVVIIYLLYVMFKP